MLVMEVGVTEASRRTGIDLSTVKQWSARGGWLAHTRAKPSLPTSMQPTPVTGIVTGVTRQPADALRDILAEDDRETRISLSRSARRLAKEAENAPLEQAGDVKQVAQTAALVHRWQEAGQAGASVVVNIALLGQQAGGEAPCNYEL